MSTREQDQASLLWKVLLLLTILSLLNLQQLVEHVLLELEEAQYLGCVSGTLAKGRVSILLHLNDPYHYVVALDDPFQPLHHILAMCLRIPLVVVDIVNVVLIPRPIDLHGLQELDEVRELACPADA